MLTVKMAPEENGARANQFTSGSACPAPEGWIAVPQELEEQAMAMLPWLAIEVADGVITAVTQNTQAKAEFEKAQEAANELNK